MAEHEQELSCLGSGLTKEEEAKVSAEGVPGVLEMVEASGASQNTGYPDYLADAFVGANSSNYTAGRGGNVVEYLVVHVIQGSAQSAIDWFHNANANVSATYVLDENRSAQCVGEQNTTWANGNWAVNQKSVTIEHRGVYNDPNNWSDALLRRSAKIAAGVIHRNPRILLDRSHIFGHGEIVNSSHPYCPGKYFPYDRYIALIKEYLRKGVSPAPAKPAPVSPKPSSRISWVNLAYSDSDSEAKALAERYAASLRKSGAPVGSTAHVDKAARNSLKNKTVLSVIIGKAAQDEVRKNDPKAWEKDDSYITGPVMSALDEKHLRYRIATICELGGYDKAVALPKT